MQKTLLYLIILAAVFAGCSKKPPQPSAVIGERILASLRSITSAYENKDLFGFMSYVSKDFPERDGLSHAVSAVFSEYNSIKFSVQYTKMLVMIDEKGGSRVSFTWDAEWHKGPKIIKDGGRVTFVYDRDERALKNIEGRNPFIPTESGRKQQPDGGSS